MPTKKTTKATKTTKAKPKFDPEARLSAVRQKIGRRGGLQFRPVHEMTNVYNRRRPTGIDDLTRATGGGYPCGGHVVLMGPANVGKDLVINKAISENQKIHGEDSRVAIFYTEGQWDKEYARMLGVQVGYSDEELDEKGITDRKERSTRKNMTLGRIDHITAIHAESIMDTIMDLADSGAYQYIIINSIDGLTLAAEQIAVAKDGIKEHGTARGGQGRGKLMSHFLANLTGLMNEPIEILEGKKVVDRHWRDTTFLWTAQQHVTQKGQYSGFEYSGGSKLKHYAALRLVLSRDKDNSTYRGNKSGAMNLVTSDLILVDVQKGKFGVCDGGKASFRFYKRDHKEGSVLIPAGTVDDTVGLRVACLHAGLIKKCSGGFNIFANDESDYVPGARDVLDDWLFSRPDIREKLKEKLDGFEEADSEVEESGEESS